jgi:phosphoenolpyruvate carboxylase
MVSRRNYSRKYAGNVQDICRKICRKYAGNMSENMQEICKNICRIYVTICKKYARNMQKICSKYAKQYARNMQKMQENMKTMQYVPVKENMRAHKGLKPHSRRHNLLHRPSRLDLFHLLILFFIAAKGLDARMPDTTRKVPSARAGGQTTARAGDTKIIFQPKLKCCSQAFTRIL